MLSALPHDGRNMTQETEEPTADQLSCAVTAVSRLNHAAFSEFTFRLIQSGVSARPVLGSGPERLQTEVLERVDESSFLVRVSEVDYGGPPIEHFSGRAYLNDAFPLEVLEPEPIRINTDVLKLQIAPLRNHIYPHEMARKHHTTRDGAALYFLSNLTGYHQDFYVNELLPKYDILLEKGVPGFHKAGVGSPDVFARAQPQEFLRLAKTFLGSSSDGIVIQGVGTQECEANEFRAGRYISGLLAPSRELCEPVYTSEIRRYKSIYEELSNLVERDAREQELEAFIARHYDVIFGAKYDRIETQVWLRFPNLDLGKRERRTDVFLRNVFNNDWDVLELKRAKPITKSQSGYFAFVDAVTQGTTQVKNYQRILKQREVKEALKLQGIDYCEPSLCLVIGRRPQIDRQQWRWLVEHNTNGVKLITYDDLLDKFRMRIIERQQTLGLVES